MPQPERPSPEDITAASPVAADLARQGLPQEKIVQELQARGLSPASAASIAAEAVASLASSTPAADEAKRSAPDEGHLDIELLQQVLNNPEAREELTQRIAGILRTALEAHPPDLELRYNRVGSWAWLLFGALVVSLGWMIPPAQRASLTVLGMEFIGLLITLYGLYRVMDRRVKLSLTGKGLRDHRTGSFFPWTEIRDARLHGHLMNGIRVGAFMYVTVAPASREREIQVDVAGLDRSPEEIVHRVRQRASSTDQ